MILREKEQTDERIHFVLGAMGKNRRFCPIRRSRL